MRICIGYIVWDATGPVRNIRSAGQWFERKEPIKVYKTAQVAERYIKENQTVKPVFIEEEEE